VKNIFIIKTVDGNYIRVENSGTASELDFLGLDSGLPRYLIKKCTIGGVNYENVCVPFSSIIFYGYKKEA